MDFCGSFPSGEQLLVIVDDYSRFPEVEIVHSTSAQATIPELDATLARHGIPNIVRTDNRPPFNSSVFHSWCQMIRLQHRKITPLWPQANGEAERLMRTLEKGIRTAMLDAGSWKQELHQFLRHYHATPHSTTGKSPAELLYGRKIKWNFPSLPPKDVRYISLMTQRKSYADVIQERIHERTG